VYKRQDITSEHFNDSLMHAGRRFIFRIEV
jgi:hypothetical protein